MTERRRHGPASAAPIILSAQPRKACGAGAGPRRSEGGGGHATASGGALSSRVKHPCGRERSCEPPSPDRGSEVGAAVFCGEEDDMSETTPALDEAYERIASASFELPNGFVNHGAMACEALAVLDCAGDIDSWARRFARAGGASVDPVVPAGFEWRQALGDYGRLPEWIGHFTQAIDDDGWPAVVATWVPRLMPALRTALFHGAIRTAHAVRAIDTVDTPPRRGELARALGY